MLIPIESLSLSPTKNSFNWYFLQLYIEERIKIYWIERNNHRIEAIFSGKKNTKIKRDRRMTASDLEIKADVWCTRELFVLSFLPIRFYLLSLMYSAHVKFLTHNFLRIKTKKKIHAKNSINISSNCKMTQVVCI